MSVWCGVRSVDLLPAPEALLQICRQLLSEASAQVFDRHLPAMSKTLALVQQHSTEGNPCFTHLGLPKPLGNYHKQVEILLVSLGMRIWRSLTKTTTATVKTWIMKRLQVAQRILKACMCVPMVYHGEVGALMVTHVLGHDASATVSWLVGNQTSMQLNILKLSGGELLF